MKICRRNILKVTLGLLLPLQWGCPSTNTTPTNPAGPATAPVLKLSTSDPAWQTVYRSRATGWAGKLAQVEWVPQWDQAEVGILSVGDFTAAVTRQQLAPMPDEFRATDHPAQRNRMIELYRDTLCSWAGTTFGLPIHGDGAVLVYRVDRFNDPQAQAEYRRRYGRSLLPPRTWDDVLETVEYFSELDRSPRFAPWGSTGAANRAAFLMGRFGQIAICHDRIAQKESVKTTVAATSFGIFWDPATGTPQLDRPSIRYAAEIWQKLARQTAPGSDPVTALEAGAVLGILDLSMVAKLPQDPATGAIVARYGLAPLPGGAVVFAADGTPSKTPEGNWVPYLGSNARIAVVFARCTEPVAAWNLLANAVSPQGSTSLLADPQVAAGPFRRDHLDDAKEGLWLGYRFDPNQTRKLAQALRAHIGLDTLNPVVVERHPEMPVFQERFATLLQEISLGGPVGPRLQAAQQAWLSHYQQLPESARLLPFRQSLGLK